MNYLAIGLVIIIIIILYNMYYYITNNALTSGLQQLNKQIVKTYDVLKDPNSMSYSYQCWLYFSSAPSNQIVFCRKTNSNDKDMEEFAVKMNGQSLTLHMGSGATKNTQIMTITDNFPIQKWSYLVINVINARTCEAYINGKLVKTVNSSTSLAPNTRTSSLYIGNSGIDGYVTKFIREPKPLEAQKIWYTYLEGNGLTNYFSSLIPYGLNMTVSKGEELQRVIKIF